MNAGFGINGTGDKMENLYAFLQQSENTIVLTVDQDMYILEANRAFCKFFLLDTVPVGRPLRDFFVNSSLAVLEDAKGLENAFHTKTKGSIMFSDLVVHSFKTEGGFLLLSEPKNVIESDVMNEISRLNQDLIDTTRDLDRKNIELEETMERLKRTQVSLVQKEQLAGLGRVAGGLAHEINNPLGIVMSAFDLLKDFTSRSRPILAFALASKEFEKYLERTERDLLQYDLEDLDEVMADITSALERIRVIVHSFRAYIGVDIGTKQYAYDVNEGIQRTLEILSAETPEDIQIQTDFRLHVPILIDGRGINVVLSHVLRNSLQALQQVDPAQEKWIRIQTVDEKEWVKIEIEDNGHGMKEAVRLHAFDPFYTTRKVGDGVGLGLTVAYEIVVRENGGRLELESTEGKGTRVTITLPKIGGQMYES